MEQNVESNDSAPIPAQTPRRPSPAVSAGLLVLGAIIGGMAVEYWLVTRGVSTTGAQTAVSGDATADVAHLMSVLPTQSHTMKDVGDHWVKLWFAVERENWPLARFYFDQARQQARWTVAIRPERLLPDGSTVDVKGLWTAADLSAFATVQFAIEDESREDFVVAYEQTLAACHTCHTALEMPFLRPEIPTVPPSTAIGFDPAVP